MNFILMSKLTNMIATTICHKNFALKPIVVISSINPITTIKVAPNRIPLNELSVPVGKLVVYLIINNDIRKPIQIANPPRYGVAVLCVLIGVCGLSKILYLCAIFISKGVTIREIIKDIKNE